MTIAAFYFFFPDWQCWSALRLKDQNLNPLWTDCFMCFHFDSRSFRWWISKSLVDFFFLFFQVASVLPGTLNWIATSFLGLFFSGSFSAAYFVLKSLHYAFFLWPFWTQYTSDFLSRISLQNNQIWKQRKVLKTFELGNSNMISSRFCSP